MLQRTRCLTCPLLYVYFFVLLLYPFPAICSFSLQRRQPSLGSRLRKEEIEDETPMPPPLFRTKSAEERWLKAEAKKKELAGRDLLVYLNSTADYDKENLLKGAVIGGKAIHLAEMTLAGNFRSNASSLSRTRTHTQA